jgi:hypothetical protein
MISTHENIVSLASELTKLEETKADYTPLTTQMEMSADGTKMGLEGIGAFSMNSHFEGQIADRLSIPRKYYEYMNTVPELKSMTVNKILNHKNERRMVRTLEGGARAFLSDRYKPIDHLFVIEPFMEALSEYKRKSGGEFNFRATSLSPSRLYVQISFPNITGEIVSTGRGKEMVNAGIALTNSEIGLGAFDVRSFIWWQWCSNGATAESYIRKYHTGRKVGDDESDYAVYSDKTIALEMKAFQSRLSDIFHNALTDDSFQDIIRKIQRTTDDKIERPKTLIQNVTKKYVLSEEFGERILANMVTEGNMNRYGLLNGITRLAQEVQDADVSYNLERLGSDIIELKPSEWSVIANKEEAVA